MLRACPRTGRPCPINCQRCRRGGSTRWWRRTRALVLARDGYVCQINGPCCTGVATTVDHIRRVVDGGTDDLANLRAACARCNYGQQGYA